MATIKFPGLKEYSDRLRALSEAADSGEITERAVAKGAGIVADTIRSGIASIPTQKYHRLKDGEYFTGISASQKKDLADSFGLTRIDRDRNGFVNTHAGFDGYGSHPTPKYPRGLPNQMLARVVESGSSVRIKYPFMRTAVRKSKKPAIQAMDDSIDNDLKKIF